MFFGCVKSSRSIPMAWLGEPRGCEHPEPATAQRGPVWAQSCRAQERKLLNTSPAARETEGPARPASPLLPLSSPVQIVLPSDPQGRICQTKQQESDPNGNTLHFLEGRVSLCYTSLSSGPGPWQWPVSAHLGLCSSTRSGRSCQWMVVQGP